MPADGIAPAKGQAARARINAAEASPVSAAQFDEFHKRLFLPLVRRAMWRHRLSGEDARDIVQEAFLLALGKLKPGGDPACWFIKVVDHLCVNLRRKAARRSGLQALWGRVSAPSNDSDTSMDRSLEAPETGGDS